MRKVFAFLAVPFCMACVAAPVLAQKDQPPQKEPVPIPDQLKRGPGRYLAPRLEGMYADVPRDKYPQVYEFIESLTVKGILNGYPPLPCGPYKGQPTYRGQRTLTRFELAWALDRLVTWVLANTVSPEEFNALKLRVDGHDTDITNLKNKDIEHDKAIEDLNNRLKELDAKVEDYNKKTNIRIDELAKRLADLIRTVEIIRRDLNALGTRVDRLEALVAALDRRVSILEGRPRFYGNIFLGVRTDQGRNYADRDGRVSFQDNGNGKFPNPNLRDEAVVTHDIMLGFTGNIGTDARRDKATTYDVQLHFGNYNSYLNNDVNVVFPGSAVNTTPRMNAFLDVAEVKAPLPGIGRDSNIMVGRIRKNLTPLTFWKPDADSYFYNPTLDDGKFRMDGFDAKLNFGSLTFDAFAGKFDTIQNFNGGTYQTPIAGASNYNITTGGKPLGNPDQGQIVLDQLAGVHLAVPFRWLEGGHVGFTWLAGTGNNAYGGGNALANAGYNSYVSFGGNAGIKINDKFSFEGEYNKSLTAGPKLIGIPLAGNEDNNAFTGNLAYNNGKLNARAGYKYIDPLFYAPGYWGRIGNWINPTNVKGPTFRASYDVTSMLSLNVGGDFYTGARNRDPGTNLGINDDINRIVAGANWKLSKHFGVGFDWEGVFWSLDNNYHGFGPTGSTRIEEHYFNFTTGYSLSDAMMIKLGVQLGTYDGHGIGGGAGTPANYNFNAYTASFNVKF